MGTREINCLTNIEKVEEAIKMAHNESMSAFQNRLTALEGEI